MKYRTGVVSFIVFLMLTMALAKTTLAEDKEGSNSHESTAVLEEVVVTATRDREEVRQIPANVTVITARQIEQSGATTIPELLERQESIQFRDYSGNGASTAAIDMRGFGGDNPFGKTLIMLDGMRMNPTDMSTFNWMQIPLNNIERIEIVRGTGSVLYGDTAIGGTINIITKQGSGKPQFNAGVSISSYGMHDERAGVSGSEGRLSYAATAENRFGWGYRDRSKSDAQGGNFNLAYQAAESIRLSLEASINNNSYQWPGALTKAQMEADRRQAANPNDDQKDSGLTLSGHVDADMGTFGRFDIGFQYAERDRKANMDSWGQWTETSDQTLALTPKYILDKNIAGRANKLTVGLDYYSQPYKKDFFRNRETSVRTSWADFLRSSTGGYIRDEFAVFKKLILNAGYRIDSTIIGGSMTDTVTSSNSFAYADKRYNAEAWEVGLTYLLGEKSKIFTKYGTLFRIPFMDEIASYNGFSSGSFNRNLEVEKGSTMEAGTQFFPLKDLKIGMTVFRTDMTDEIQYVYTSTWTGENRNVGKTRHDGIEASVSYEMKGWFRIYGNATYQKATYEDGQYNKKEMYLVPNRMANLGVDIFLPGRITLQPDVRYVGDRFLSQDFTNTAEKLEAYTLLNVALLYRPTICKVHLTAFIGADNLANVKYVSFGSNNSSWGGANTYYPMPGVVFKGGLSFAF
ncbi:MAG: TonB-dependent receptor [Syntrophus sp. SKADARSKE-3]|nr:TonB-dependent receptor [Syntrophus sp. SKADARSKE-3]